MQQNQSKFVSKNTRVGSDYAVQNNKIRTKQSKSPTWICYTTSTSLFYGPVGRALNYLQLLIRVLQQSQIFKIQKSRNQNRRGQRLTQPVQVPGWDLRWLLSAAVDVWAI